MKNIKSPHDRYFKSMMSDHKTAREFFEQHLPIEIKNIVDISTIHPQKDSFVGDSLGQQIADLLFSVNFNGSPGYIYILIEHQSTPDKMMPFRIFKYILAIMEQHLKKTKKSKLPIIYPMIFYSGWKKYNYSTNIFDLFEDDKKLAIETLYKPYQLIDLTKISDEKLKENLLHGLFARVMKNAFRKNNMEFATHLKEIIEDLEPIKNISGMEYIYATLTYIFEAYDIQDQEFTEIVRENLTFVDEDKIMTLADQWREEGRQEILKKTNTIADQWREEGRQEILKKTNTIADQWREEGRQEILKKTNTIADQWREEGRQEILKKTNTIAIKLLAEGMPSSQVAYITDLPIEKVETLKNKNSK